MPAKKTLVKQSTARKNNSAAKKSKIPPSVRTGIVAWEDDPLSTAAVQPIPRPVPDLAKGPYALRIAGPKPAARIYASGTPGFRYWALADAVRRGSDFWRSVLTAAGRTGISWQPGATLAIKADEGVDFNAYYDRKALNFFHDTAAGETVYSGESPDIACHELGHAVLDSFRPQLWDSASDEIAAFHESFGDMSALLSGLQTPSLRQAVLNETGGKLYRSSRLSRLAEQLGWAIRHSHPDLVEHDCLRNAVNSFFYRAPDTLPPSGPSSSLSSEAHSFSRVFTGGFFAALGGMLAIESSRPSEADLQQVSFNMGKLLVKAILGAQVVPDFFSQVALQMIAEDKAQFKSKYRDALKSAFVQRGILSLQAAVQISRGPAAGRGVTPAASAPAYEVASMVIPGDGYGLKGEQIRAHIPGGHRPFAAAAALDLGTAEPPSGDKAGRSFVEDLFRRGRVELGAHGQSDSGVAHPLTVKTHYLEKQGSELALKRRTFECGFGPFC